MNQTKIFSVTRLALFLLFSLGAASLGAAPVKNDLTDMNKGSAPKIDLAASLLAGYYSNEQNYLVSSPLAGVILSAESKFKLAAGQSLKLAYQGSFEKSFASFPLTSLTLDTLKQDLKLRYGLNTSKFDLAVNLEYRWLLKPQWPDLYQPVPLLAASGATTSYLGTDRYSYHRLAPEIYASYQLTEEIPLFFKAGLTRQMGYQDPAFLLTLPMHLTPHSYTAFAGELGVKYSKKNSLISAKFSNTLTYLADDFALARDARTGLTHYSGATQPANPLYTELNNLAALDVIFNFQKQNLQLTPFLAYEINADLFQGYNSYGSFQLGVKLSHEVSQAISYQLKISQQMASYGANSYDGTTANHLPLTSGTSLYKNTTRADAGFLYAWSKNLEIFADAGLTLHSTNFPDYVPGVNPLPGSKNYNIKFNYSNFDLKAGVTYRL